MITPQGYKYNLFESLKRAINNCPLIVGIGPSAWPRIISAYFFPKFKILTYHDCQDNDFIAESGVEVFCLRARQPDLEVSPVTPGQILATDLAKSFLTSQKEPFALLVYKSSAPLEKLCTENNWRLIANPKQLVETWENKKNFKESLPRLGIEPIPGENLPIDDLTKEKLAFFQKKYGQRLVLQMAEMTYGGGSGTLFIRQPADLIIFRQRVEEIRKKLEGKKKKIETVNVAPYIEGTSSSVVCCTTKFGTLVGPIQTQIIDVDEVGTRIKNRSGNYAGHDWSLTRYSKNCQQQAGEIASRFGRYLYQKGYRGIFGLDLIVNHKNDKVWPVECNPRDTDAFPLISMLMMEKGLIPFDVFHNLELLGINYEIDFPRINQSYQQAFEASQIILHNRSEQPVVSRGGFKAGVHELKNGRLEWLRPGFMFSDLKKENEYLFTEGISKLGQPVFYGNGRICRLIKKRGMLGNESQLIAEVKQVIKMAYKKMRLIPAESGLKEISKVNFLFAEKLINAKRSQDLAKADVVNILAKIPGGFWRPNKIAWRKEINDLPILAQISSRRARKQIKTDERKLVALGIEIKVVPEIDERHFLDWLALYRRLMADRRRGEAVIGQDWLAKKKVQGKRPGAILAISEGKLIGGNLFLEVQERLCAGYGVAERVRGLAGGLGLLLDYYFLIFAQKEGFKQVSFGQDTNLYGFDLAVGLIFYKSKLGFAPIPANRAYWLTTFFPHPEKIGEEIMFFAKEEESLVLHIINKEGWGELPLLPPGVSRCRFWSKDKISVEHQKLLSDEV